MKNLGIVLFAIVIGLTACTKPQKAQEEGPASIEELLIGRWVSVSGGERIDGILVADSGDVAGSCIIEYKPEGAVSCYWVDPDSTTRIDYNYTVDAANSDIINTYQTHHIEELTDSTLWITYGMGITAEGDTVRGEYWMKFKKE